jgi:hypothetical protein
MIIKFVLLAALVRILLITDNPLLCSGIYTAVVFILSLVGGAPLPAILIVCAIVFGVSFLYFYLLNRFDSGTVIWWVIAIAGALLIFL